MLKYFREQKKMAAVIMAAIFFIVCDRFLKCLAVNDFLSNKKIIGDFFQLNFASNYNIAFSLPLAGWWLNVLIVLIIVVLVYNLLRLPLKRKHDQANFLLIIIFGAVSNLFDRIKYGYVIDYFDLKYWTVFNLADVMIVGGTIFLGWTIFKEKRQ